jgi:hypothetical protein
MGCVIEGSSVTPARSIEMESHFRADSYYHDAVRFVLNDAQGRSFSIEGEVLSFVPLRHRKEGRETVYLGQAMARFRLGGRETLGLSEYFDAESACDALVRKSNAGEWARE